MYFLEFSDDFDVQSIVFPYSLTIGYRFIAMFNLLVPNDTRTANGSELFSLTTCLHTTTFTLLSTISPLGMISMKIWETPLPWHAKCSLLVAVRVSKTRVLKLHIIRTSRFNYPAIAAIRFCNDPNVIVTVN